MAYNFLTEQEVVDYAKEHNLTEAFCIECGKPLTYGSTKMYIGKDGKLRDKAESINFLKSREYNGNIYHICRCKECVAKKYPNILKAKTLYTQKWAFASQYAFNVPDEDFVELAKTNQSLTIEKMINKYGEEEGTRKWDEYCQKQAYTNSFEYKKEKHGMTADEYDKYNKSRSNTIENFIKRYGEEEGTRKWNEYIEKERYSNSLEYFITTYGEEEGIKIFNNLNESKKKKRKTK